MQRLEPKGRISETILRVRYAETDAMGIVHHSSYLPWFELGRSDWLREAGLSYGDFVKMGFYLTVTEVCARYYRPAVYDETVIVSTWVEKVRSRALTLAYDVRNDRDQRLVMACTRHVCITHDGKPSRLPEALYRLLSGSGSN